MDSGNVGHVVEVPIEGEDPVDAVASHDRQVKRIPGGEVRRQYHFFGVLEHSSVQRIELVEDARQDVKGWLDGISASDGHVSVQDFLKHFDITDEAIVRIEACIEKLSRPLLVRMSSSHEVHRNIGVDEDQWEGSR